MKKIIPFILILGILACNNNTKTPKSTAGKDSTKVDTLPTVCTFGLLPEQFNESKRTPVEDETIAKGKPVKPTNPPPGPTPPSGSGVIYLDFDGQLVSGTSWNFFGDITCANANMNAADMQTIMDGVTTKYSTLWQVTVTTDEAVFNAANAYKKMRVIFTESFEWYGRSGGTSFIGSFTTGKNDPCFVFTSLLGYNVKYVMESACHEIGHTLGLYHESIFDANGVKLMEYNPGGCQTIAGCSKAPVMGNAYNQPLSIFLSNGINAYNQPVDEFAVISSKIPKK